MRIQEVHQHDQKRKTLSQDYRHHPCVPSASRGDDQGPHTDDVSYNIHKMGHTQVIRQYDLFQSGARGYPIACLSAFQSVDDEFGHGKPIQATEHTGSCPLQTPFKQSKIKQRVVNELLTVPTAQIIAKRFYEYS